MTTRREETIGIQPFDVAVIIPTVLRPSLLNAVRSIFEQDFHGTIQIMIGVDLPLGDLSMLDILKQECPPTMMITIINPGYSTAIRNGGLYECLSGGTLRPIMSFAAHSRYLAFLDDDNWLDTNHISSLIHTISGHDFAYSRRFMVDPRFGHPIGVDIRFSLGIGIWPVPHQQGVFFTDTNTLLIDKIRCRDALALWLKPCLDNVKGYGDDRRICQWLFDHHNGAATGLPTVFYRIDLYNAEAHIHELRKNHNPWPWEQAMRSGESRHQHLIETIATQAPILHLDPNAEAKNPISPTMAKAIMTETGATTALVLRDRGAALSRSLAQAADNRAAAFIGVDSGCGDLIALRQAEPARANDSRCNLAAKSIRAERSGDLMTTIALFFLPQSPAIAMRYFAYYHLAFDLIMLAPITATDDNYSTKLLNQAWQSLATDGCLVAVDRLTIATLKHFATEVFGQLIGDESQANWMILRKQVAPIPS